MRLLRVALTVVLAVLLGFWAYERLDTVEISVGEPLVEFVEAGSGFGLVAIVIAVGFVVARPWALLALVGPVLSLAYAEIQGERGSDGVEPLTSAPSIVRLFILGLLLLLGVGVGRAAAAALRE